MEKPRGAALLAQLARLPARGRRQIGNTEITYYVYDTTQIKDQKFGYNINKTEET